DVASTYELDGERLVLRGRKRWASLSPIADVIVLIVRDPASPPERPRLRAVLLPRDTAGLAVETMPPPPFIPEIPHAELGLDGVSVEASALLPGDAYEARVKPFRSLEDLHVTAATLGHLIGVGRRTGGAEPLVERLVALAAAAPGIGELGPSLPEAHLVLGGWLSAVRELAPALDSLFARADAGERERWERDRVLLEAAGRVRARRTERAWERIRGGTS
ncbi:MAG: acyl-CoA dehydrogenase family protein, partial [Deltaproteobacteria bacterium]|nr:acyl-CoA dehydrogenase family protein [Deltaproteobacteria bacterium]